MGKEETAIVENQKFGREALWRRYLMKSLKEVKGRAYTLEKNIQKERIASAKAPGHMAGNEIVCLWSAGMGGEKGRK